MSGYLTILLGIILVNNYVLAQFLGICPFLGVSKKLDSAVGMGVAVTFVMVLATAATWPIMQALNNLNIAYLQTIVFILIIAALVQFVEMALKKFIPSLHKALGVYLPLITTNCAVLGVCISNIDSGYNYLESLVNSFGAGVGFLLAMVIGNEKQTGGKQRYSGAFPGSSDHHDYCGSSVAGIHGLWRISVG